MCMEDIIPVLLIVNSFGVKFLSFTHIYVIIEKI